MTTETEDQIEQTEAGEIDANDPFADIDEPGNEALLMGGADDAPDDDADALAELAADDPDPVVEQQSVESTPRAADIPAERVGQVITQLRDMHDRLGLQAPDFGDAVAMSGDDFADLVTLRNRMKIKVAAASVDLDEDPPARRESQQPDEPEIESVDLDERERAYLEAQYEGDTETALAIRREINAELRRQAEVTAAQQALHVAAQQRTQADLRQIAANALKAYPVLNENDGDNPAMNEVVEWRDFYQAKGLPPAQALANAVAKVGPLYAQPPVATQSAVPPKADTRKADAIARNAAAANAQAPATDVGIGNRAVPPTPRIETQEDWERLPDTERARLLM